MLGHHRLAIALLATAVSGCALVEPRPEPLAQTCAEWWRLSADQRLQTAQAFIPPELMASARKKQHLPPETSDGAVFAAVRGSIDKVCELEGRPGLTLTEVTTSLFR